MASQFTGLQMRVVLRDPAEYMLTGTVSDVQAGSSLTLTNGKRVPFTFDFVSFAFLLYAPKPRHLVCTKTNPPIQYSSMRRASGFLTFESTPPTLPISKKLVAMDRIRSRQSQNTLPSSHPVNRWCNHRRSQLSPPLLTQLF